MKLDPVSLVELLNEIGARNAIGRVDLVENRFVGIKSRGCYETPGGTLLIAAHRELEALCLEREVAHFKQHVGLKYAELVYFGLWFTPLREALDAFVASTQTEMTGSVTLSLYKGNVSVVSRQSEHSLYRTDLSSFTMGDSYDQKDAAGFHSNPRTAFAHARAGSRGGCAMKMWSGRFRQPLDPQFERWQRSFDFDRRLLSYELAASGAHARALKNAGVLSADELISILEGLQQIGEMAAGSKDFVEDDEAEDVHHFVEKQLVSRIGEVGYKLHSGRSRNEQIATDLRLYVRAAIDELRSELADVCGAFADRAEQAGSAAMPAYTHLQRAEPVLVAHWLLAYVEMFLRDADRLADCRKRLNVCPLGSGAVAGATLPLDRAFMADELDFDGPTANSIDATSDRDFVIEFVNTLSLLGLHLSRWAEEMIIFSTQEFGFVQLPEAYSTGSSAMPQKKNPDLLELVRGKTGRVDRKRNRTDGCVERLASGLQQRLAGNATAAVRCHRHGARITAVGRRVDESSRVRPPAHERGGAVRIHERVGGRDLPGQPRRSFATRARADRQGREAVPGKTLRASGSDAGSVACPESYI